MLENVPLHRLIGEIKKRSEHLLIICEAQEQGAQHIVVDGKGDIGTLKRHADEFFTLFEERGDLN
jgi:hypothetical protein